MHQGSGSGWIEDRHRCHTEPWTPCWVTLGGYGMGQWSGRSCRDYIPPAAIHGYCVLLSAPSKVASQDRDEWTQSSGAAILPHKSPLAQQPRVWCFPTCRMTVHTPVQLSFGSSQASCCNLCGCLRGGAERHMQMRSATQKWPRALVAFPGLCRP